MAGGGNLKKPSPASSSHPNNKRPSSAKPNKPTPSAPKPDPAHSKLPPFPFLDPPPPPSYGFHMLDRRTALLADGSVRSYFALPPDYPPFDRQFPMSPDFRNMGPIGPRGGGPGIGPGGGEISMKRKYVEEERQRQQLVQFGNGPGPGPGPSSWFRGEEVRGTKFMRVEERNGGRGKHGDVDQGALKKAFLHFLKVLYENGNQKRRYLDDGKQGSLRCLACQRFDCRSRFLDFCVRICSRLRVMVL